MKESDVIGIGRGQGVYTIFLKNGQSKQFTSLPLLMAAIENQDQPETVEIPHILRPTETITIPVVTPKEQSQPLSIAQPIM